MVARRPARRGSPRAVCTIGSTCASSITARVSRPASREQVFQPFQRLGDRGGSGVGLGLAVARGFVRAMEGELLIEDTPDGGTTAVVSLGIAS